MPTKTNAYIREAYARGYRVTEDGRVMSHKGKILSTKIPKGGRYPQMSIALPYSRASFHVHRFAAYCYFGEEAFQEGMHVRHLNGDRTDFRRENIAIGTPKENNADKSPEAKLRSIVGSAKARTGKPADNRKFTDEQLLEIRNLLKNGGKPKRIAELYGCSDTTIYNIKNDKYYTIKRIGAIY